MKKIDMMRWFKNNYGVQKYEIVLYHDRLTAVNGSAMISIGMLFMGVSLPNIAQRSPNEKTKSVISTNTYEL